MFEHPESRSLPRRGPARGTSDDCMRIDELLEAFVDDELSAAERSLVDVHLATCAHCASQLSLAQRVRGSLRELPAQAFPPSLLPTDVKTDAGDVRARRGERSREDTRRSVVSLRGWRPWRSKRHAGGSPNGRRGGRLSGKPSGKPSGSPPAWAATAIAAGLVAVLAAGLFLRPATPVPSHDVAQAEAEVKLALAYLGRIGERTGSIVAQDVLEERVAAPIARSVQRVLKPTAGTTQDGGP